MRLVRRAAVTAAATFTAATLAVTTPLGAASSSVEEAPWVPVLVAGAPVTDDPGDAFRAAMDVVGDSEHPAAYVRSEPSGWGPDGTISFRLRLDGNPLKSDAIEAGQWIAQLSTNEDVNAYDAAVVVLGGGAQRMNITYNTDRQCCHGDFPEEEAEGDLVLGATVFVSQADTSYSGTPDYFLDWKTGLNGPLGDLPGADGPVRVLLGTSLDSAGTLTIGADVAGSSDAAAASWEFNGSDLYGRSPVDGNLVRETTPPTVAFGPMASFALDRAQVVWQGTDPDTGIADYDLHQRLARWDSGFGAESAVLTRSELTESQQTLPRGATACYTVRARNGAHLTSEWAGPQCVARPLDQGFLAASKGWKTVKGSSYWGQSAQLAKRRGATLSLVGVKAKRLAVVATTCPSCGKVKVVLGGKARGTVNLRSATTEHRQVLELPPFARKTGKLQLEVVSSGKPVRIDGVGISAG